MAGREPTEAARAPAHPIRRLRIPLILLLVAPVAPALHYFTLAPAPWVFLTGAIAIAILADWVRRATEQVTAQVGPAVGGLLNVSFGSVAELILALSVLAGGNGAVVRAQITGSIIGTSLLGLGLAIVIGSIGRTQQVFNQKRAGLRGAVDRRLSAARPRLLFHNAKYIAYVSRTSVTFSRVRLSNAGMLVERGGPRRQLRAAAANS